MSCTQRIIGLSAKLRTVYVGVQEPKTFVGQNDARELLGQLGVKVVLVEGLEEEILKVATSGHVKKNGDVQ